MSIFWLFTFDLCPQHMELISISVIIVSASVYETFPPHHPQTPPPHTHPVDVTCDREGKPRCGPSHASVHM